METPALTAKIAAQAYHHLGILTYRTQSGAALAPVKCTEITLLPSTCLGTLCMYLFTQLLCPSMVPRFTTSESALLMGFFFSWPRRASAQRACALQLSCPEIHSTAARRPRWQQVRITVAGVKQPPGCSTGGVCRRRGWGSAQPYASLDIWTVGGRESIWPQVELWRA